MLAGGGVIRDLMIHDIDIVQSIVGRPIESIDAVGAAVFSPEIDIANARIRYANGCVANTTASRVSMKMERKLRLFHLVDDQLPRAVPRAPRARYRNRRR